MKVFIHHKRYGIILKMLKIVSDNPLTGNFVQSFTSVPCWKILNLSELRESEDGVSDGWSK